MDGSFTSGSFGELVVGFSHFHDYRELPYEGSGNCKLYTVISGERKLILKAANKEKGSLTENIARLQREYKLLERLYGNEHIVRCIGWREDAEVGPCIVMEFIDGETLAAFLASSPSNKEKKRILNELLDALTFIHSPLRAKPRSGENASVRNPSGTSLRSTSRPSAISRTLIL